MHTLFEIFVDVLCGFGMTNLLYNNIYIYNRKVIDQHNSTCQDSSRLDYTVCT